MFFSLFVAAAFAALYKYWGDHEYGYGTYMLLLSIAVSGIAIAMGWRFFGVFAGQMLIGVIFLIYHFTRPMTKNF